MQQAPLLSVVLNALPVRCPQVTCISTQLESTQPVITRGHLDIKFEVQRLAGIARDRHAEAEEGVLRAAKDGETYTPFMLEQVVRTQVSFALWERTRYYVSEGTEAPFVIGDDRLADSDDPKAALQNLLGRVKDPTPHRGAGFPMDDACHVLEKQQHKLWRESCSDLLARICDEPSPDSSD